MWLPPDSEPFIRWVDYQLGSELEHLPHIVLATRRNDEFAAAVLHSFVSDDIELTVASTGPGWASRRFLHAIAYTVFVTNKAKRLTAYVAASNEPSERALVKAGFKREGTKRRAMNGEDVHLYGMLREECRWLDDRSASFSPPLGSESGLGAA